MSERRRDDEATDLGTLARDDALLDALGRGDPAPEGDELATLLAAWRADLADDSATEVRPAAPPAGGPSGPPRPALRRSQPWALRLAAAAVVLVALVSGLGIGSRNAGPDNPLWSLTRLLYPEQAEVRSVEDSIVRARTALGEGRLDDAERLIERARRNLAAVDDPAAVDRLRATIEMLARELRAARDATTPGPTGAEPASPGPTAAPGPTAGTPRPSADGATPEPSHSPSIESVPQLPLPEVSLPIGPLLSPLPSLPLPTDGLLG